MQEARSLVRFEREARLLASLNHPNIATIHSFEHTDGVHFLVLELVEGNDLRELLRAGPMEVDRGLQIAADIAQGLEAAHERDIVHRDLKPANVIITQTGGVKLLDFGIAKMLGPEILSGALPDEATMSGNLTIPGSVLGTAAYMSPEQARAHPLDKRTDIWAFGCVVYELLTGKQAFGRGALGETLAAILEQEPAWHLLPEQAPPAVLSLLQRCLRKNPAQRARDIWHIRVELEEERRAPGQFDAGLRCSECGEDNPDGDRFCGKCGSKLRRDCPNCGAAAATAATYCGQCGQPLRPMTASEAPSPVREAIHPAPRPAVPESPSGTTTAFTLGERRHATVLNFSLEVYLLLMEEFEPMRVQEILKHLHQQVAEAVEELDGTINQAGDESVVALFGVPATREDDAIRAIRAAISAHSRARKYTRDLEQRLGLELRLCTGINTGLVAIRPAGAVKNRYRISGEPAHIAARLAAHAGPDEILVGPETWHLVAPFFETEPLEPFAIRGRAKQIAPYRVHGESGLQSRLEATEIEGLSTYTGREREMEILAGCLKQAQQGIGQFVTVVGEAGLGKSRLLYEFKQRLDRRTVTLLSGRCQTNGGNIPYLPFIDALRGVLGLNAEAPDRELVTRVILRVRAMGMELQEFLPLYLHLMSLSTDAYPLPQHLEGRHFRLAMLEALTALFTQQAMAGPTIIIFEDWHWADEASRAVLSQICRMVGSLPLMLVVTYRPSYSPDWGNLDHRTGIHLVPLDARALMEIMKSVLGAESFPTELAELIHQRIGGNPFFLEEVCRTLYEDGSLKVDKGQARLVGSLETIELPDTVQAVIHARLSRLNPDAQEILRLAAVVGRDFSRRILSHILEKEEEHLQLSLVKLQELGLIQQFQVLPETAFRFRNVLTQEVAYNTLLQHQRRQLHGLVGDAIEQFYPERLEDRAEMLAHHFGQAQEWDKAISYGEQAARRASSLSQFSEALGTLEKVQHWLAGRPDSRNHKGQLLRLLLQQERLCETLGRRNRQQEIIDELFSLVDSQQEPLQAAEVFLRQGELHTLLGRYQEAEKALSTSLQMACETQEQAMERRSLRGLSFLRWNQGKIEEALGKVRAALQIDRTIDDRENLAFDLTNLGSLLRAAQDHSGALKYLQEACDVYKEIGLNARMIEPLHISGVVYRDLGDDEKALEQFRAAIEISRQCRSPTHLFFQLIPLGNIYLERGESDKALAHFQEAVDVGRKSKYALGLSHSLRMMGAALLALRRDAEALPHLREAVELLAWLGETAHEAVTWADIATIYQRQGNGPDALAAWERVKRLRLKNREEAGVLEAVEGMGHAARSFDPEIAVTCYAEALEQTKRLGNRPKQGDLLNTLGIIEWQCGNLEAALIHYQQALALFRELDDQTHAGLTLNSLGVVLGGLGRREEAYQRLREAVRLNRQTGERLLEGHALAALGDLLLEEGDLDEALDRYAESLEIRRQVGDRSGEGWMLQRIAKAHLKQRADAKKGHGPAQARQHLELARALAQECGDEELQRACNLLERQDAEIPTERKSQPKIQE